MTIHSDHPFADPEQDPVRRLRGRLGGAVTLWTAGASGFDRAGLTVSSVMLAAGEPARLLGLLDPDSDLADAIAATGCAVVTLLTWPDRDLAEAFAGQAPAPGGLFSLVEFEQTAWGPRPAAAASWAGVRVESTAEVGWSLLATALIEELVVGEDLDPMSHRRGRYHRL